jgi:hypothetical protein
MVPSVSDTSSQSRPLDCEKGNRSSCAFWRFVLSFVPLIIFKMHCPHCGQPIPDSMLKAYTASLAGRKATGAAKARSHEQAQHAAQMRWARAREKAAQKTNQRK